jgi:hypothetical protein
MGLVPEGEMEVPDEEELLLIVSVRHAFLQDVGSGSLFFWRLPTYLGAVLRVL